MTQHLSHTFAHLTEPSFRLKAKIFGSYVNLQNSDFQSQFSTSKIIQIFLTFFSLKNINIGARVLILTFFDNFDF